MKRASADVGLMIVAFNLRRLMNIIDKKLFQKFLQELALLFSAKMTLLIAFIINTSLQICRLLFHIHFLTIARIARNNFPFYVYLVCKRVFRQTDVGGNLPAPPSKKRLAKL